MHGLEACGALPGFAGLGGLRFRVQGLNGSWDFIGTAGAGENAELLRAPHPATTTNRLTCIQHSLAHQPNTFQIC